MLAEEQPEIVFRDPEAATDPMRNQFLVPDQTPDGLPRDVELLGDYGDGQQACGGAPRRRGLSETHGLKNLCFGVKAWVRPPSPIPPQRGAPGCLQAASATAEPRDPAAPPDRSTVWTNRLPDRDAKLDGRSGITPAEGRHDIRLKRPLRRTDGFVGAIDRRLRAGAETHRARHPPRTFRHFCLLPA
jgi:hypothetical protein